MKKIKKIFKKKPKAKAKLKPKKIEEVLVLEEDKTYDNEVQKSEVKSETKSETKSSLTFGS